MTINGGDGQEGHGGLRAFHFKRLVGTEEDLGSTIRGSLVGATGREESIHPPLGNEDMPAG